MNKIKKIDIIKKKCINEIINLIKKYNISIEEIIDSYIEKYQSFNEHDKLITKIQYYNFTKYSIL